MKRRLLSLAVPLLAAANEFEPYVLNGGLISAVAGRDYLILASDTRMVGPGGYDILERNHLSSRIWTATDSLIDTTTEGSADLLCPDGSVALSGEENTAEALALRSKRTFSKPPVFVGSAGCNADCEMLKRTVRADLRAAYYFSESQLQVQQVAVLLGQILYSRRGFPYYSFCVAAGMDGRDARVYVYDAIGSYEQVAVASTGTGRESLQPILDRRFRSRIEEGPVRGNTRMQAFGSTPLPQVSCSKEEAVSILLEGYRAVSEREIGVGDQVAFCVLHRKTDGRYECQVWSAPLKKH